MRENVIVSGHREKDRMPKVLVARAIQFLSTGVIYPLFQASGLSEQGDARELEEFRSLWIAWLDATSSASFLSYVDAYHQFVRDVEAGHWWPISAAAPAPCTALDALGARINRDRI